jgi:type I site-specific restriction endonuclease
MKKQFPGQVSIARWYQRAAAEVSEHETIAYLSAPLLQCLGWSPQKMAIEWGTVDIALFDELPRIDEHLTAVIEAKKFDDPIRTAFDQASRYAEQSGRERCRRIVLTDGIKYYVYTRTQSEKFSSHPRASL